MRVFWKRRVEVEEREERELVGSSSVWGAVGGVSDGGRVEAGWGEGRGEGLREERRLLGWEGVREVDAEAEWGGVEAPSVGRVETFDLDEAAATPLREERVAGREDGG